MLSMTVLTDGRQEYIAQALPTWIESYAGKFSHKVIIDDSGNTGYRHWLTETFPTFVVVAVGKDRCGYSSAMRKVFEVATACGQPYNLHIEDDFVLHNPPSLEDICSVLDANSDLAQMSLMRQPWYQNEINHGGVVEALEVENPNGFITVDTNGHHWTRHRAYFTCNPSIFPTWLAKRNWPDAPWSEMKFGQRLIKDGKHYGIWGERPDWVCVEHIGRERNGTEY